MRASDGLPLRIEAWAEYEQAKRKIRDEASVDYVMSSHGFLTPASVVHRHIVDGQTITENLYRYERVSAVLVGFGTQIYRSARSSAAGGACGPQEMMAK